MDWKQQLTAHRPRGEWWATALLLLGWLAVFSLLWRLTKGGTLALVGADRVLAGEIPYRDFWTMYAPGHYYLLALPISLFGSNFLVGAVVGSVLCALGIGLIHRLGWVLSDSRGLAIACGLLVGASIFSTGLHAGMGTYPPVLCCMLVALWAIALALKRWSRDRPETSLFFVFLAGLASGLAVLFKHDVGVYTAIAIASGLITFAWLSTDDLRAGLGRAVKGVLVLAAGIAIPVVPTVMVFAWFAWDDFVQDLVVFPATVFRHTRPEKFPSWLPKNLFDSGQTLRELGFAVATWTKFFVPRALWLVGAVLTALAIRSRNARIAALGVVLTAGFGLHYVAAHVQVNTHIVSMTVYAVCLMALYVGALDSGKRMAGVRLAGVTAAVVLTSWFGAMMLEPTWRLGWLLRNSRSFSELQIAKGSGTLTWKKTAEDLEALVDFVHSRVAPGDPIFVGLNRHDIVVAGAVPLQFQLDRPPAARYHEMHPGVVDTGPVQQEIVAALERQQVSVVVRQTIFDDKTLDDLKSKLQEHLPQIGATVLDEYLLEEFEPAAEFGTAVVWVRRTQDSGPQFDPPD